MTTSAGMVFTTWRGDAGWTIRRLARESGLSPAYISQLEKGQRPPTPAAAGRIADALGEHPYELLCALGFIPLDHMNEARQMAEAALEIPSLGGQARGETAEAKLDWLIIDYLYLLGDDPYGTGWAYGPGGNEADWTPLAPERMAEADANPRTAEIRKLRFPHRAQTAKPAPSPIEGWEELSDSDRHFVQQMVNKLRRSATGE
jgi:transcriptional regulator with XRE-family HTH domain